MADLKQTLGKAFLEIADAIETGNFGTSVKVGLTLFGSEHGEAELLRAAEMAAKDGQFEVVVIGPKMDTDLELFEVKDETEMHAKMEELLDNDYIQACVTLHYNFPIGVSTVGRVVVPATGKEMIIATTTGTSATARSEAMFKNAIYGISVAKSIGIKNPTVGILNVDNAKGVERALQELKSNGYNVNFGESLRADGGSVMRGNDLLMGAVDVMVTDSLTGNILMKMFSSFTTGGSYEAHGFGYGPGIGFDYNRIISIISRASGANVIANAIRYSAEAAKGNLVQKVKDEYEAAKSAKYDSILEGLKPKKVAEKPKVEVAKEVVTSDIGGIDIMDLESAADSLMAEGIYAETGMGCTGPIVLVNDKNTEKALEILANAGFIAKQKVDC